MSLITGIHDQKDHITQMIKYSQKRNTLNRHNKKIPIYFLKQIGIKT